jgi:enamine deaminase RidA (YjgF/YER057c/UK114 family)/ketosteroid isomerase-like protein
MDDDSIREVSDRFYAAVNSLLSGDAAPMLALWSHADDVTYSDPRGHVLRGWSELDPYWQEAARANASSADKIHATARNLAVHASAELGYTVTDEEAHLPGQAEPMRVRATNVYKREGTEWRMIHRHADPAPATNTPGGNDTMSRKIVTPPELPRPRGFNHGILSTGGKLLFLAGQDASDAEGRIVAPGDVVAQLDQVLHNLEAVVHAAGGTARDIVKLNIFVRDRDDYLAKLKPLGQVFRLYFGDYYPALALFEVGGFFQADALIELEGMAVIGASD